jgi:hypothetical protein
MKLMIIRYHFILCKFELVIETSALIASTLTLFQHDNHEITKAKVRSPREGEAGNRCKN